LSGVAVYLDADKVRAVRAAHGGDVLLKHFVGYSIPTLIDSGHIDCVISDCEDGFSQLGRWRSELSVTLGMPQRAIAHWAMSGMAAELEPNISSLADWCRARTPQVTLVAIPQYLVGSLLRGLILSPHEASECYRQFAQPGFGRPYRDFFYNVTYEALTHAALTLQARNIGITHLGRTSKPGVYREEVTRCQLEAMLQFADLHPQIESIGLLDFMPTHRPFDVLDRFSRLDRGVHRAIRTEVLRFWGIDFVDVSWRS
jgi:hypothetical protein